MTTTQQPPQGAVAVAPKLPDSIVRRGVNESEWRTLANNLYPGALADSVLMVVDYCRARKLDPLKKPCHIVPMKVKDAKTGNYEWRDVVMPGIYEYRITAMRTGLYLGHSRPEYGPEIEVGSTKAPQWCEMTMFRKAGADRIEFPVRVFFTEVVALKDGKPNDRWSKAPIQMLTKCCEAAGLREAFPDEFGGEVTAEEMDGQAGSVESTRVEAPQPARRLSEQPAETAAAPAKAAEPQPAAPADPQSADQPAALHVGEVVKVHERPNGWLVELGTGFRASTKDKAMADAAHELVGSGRLVELVTRPSSDPSRFAPTLEEILPIIEGEVEP